MKKILPLVVLAALAGCSSDDSDARSGANVITYNDFESMVGWVPDASTLSKEHAHSGVWAVKVSAEHEFGLTYSVTIGEVLSKKPKSVKLEAWAFMNSAQGTGSLVMEISDPNSGQQVMRDAIELGEQIKDFKKWVKVKKIITLPETLQPQHRIKIYLWRPGAPEPVYIDDLSLSAVE
jgi:hypothetical protein